MLDLLMPSAFRLSRLLNSHVNGVIKRMMGVRHKVG
jgi:hypothetical protein